MRLQLCCLAKHSDCVNFVGLTHTLIVMPGLFLMLKSYVNNSVFMEAFSLSVNVCGAKNSP